MTANWSTTIGWVMDGPRSRPSTSARRCVFTAPPAAPSLSCWRSWSRSAGWGESRRTRQRQQSPAVDMLLEMVGQLVERRLDLRLVVERRGGGPESLQPMAALTIVGQQAVDVAANDA